MKCLFLRNAKIILERCVDIDQLSSKNGFLNNVLLERNAVHTAENETLKDPKKRII